MQCSNCGKCCERTEMLLSKGDIERLERAGFSREDFTVTGEDELIRLGNVGGWCYFYDPTEEKCQVYEDRPLGCLLYPIIYSTEEGVIVDELCPMRHTISKRELKKKGKILLEHLKNMASDFFISSF
ncbi:MAG: YkgJ family cysteine cluster protein [Candidatus Bathyarchaeia archaeon]